MTREQVQVKAHYIMRIKGEETVARVICVNPRGGWFVVNVKTGREMRVNSGAKFKRLASDFEREDAYRSAVQGSKQ